MAVYSDLMGLGMAPLLASKTGHIVLTGVAGTGTAQSGATNIASSVTVGAPVASNTAYALPTIASGPAQLKNYYFFNNAVSTTSAVIFPPNDGSTLNGATSNSISLTQYQGAVFMLAGYFNGVAQWFSIKTN